MKKLAMALAVVLTVSTVGVLGADQYLKTQARERVTDTLSNLPNTIRIDFKGIELGFLARSMTLEQATVTAGSPNNAAFLTMETLDVAIDPFRGAGDRVDLTARHVTFDDGAWAQLEMPESQKDLLHRLGFDQGEGRIAVVLEHKRDVERLTGRIRYTREGASEAAGVDFELADFGQADIDGYARWAMPSVEVVRYDSVYRGDELRRAVIEAAAHQRVSAPTLLHYLLVPLGPERLQSQLNAYGGKSEVETLAVGPLLAYIELQGFAYREPTPNGRRILLQRLRISEGRFPGGVDTGPARRLRVEFAGELPNVDRLPEDAGKALAQMGYRDLEHEGVVAYRYNPETGHFALDQATWRVRDAGSATLSARLTSVQLEARAAEAMQIAQRLSIADLRLSYQDEGLVRRFIAAGAKEQGVSETVYIQRVARNVQARIPPTANGVARLLRDALPRFLHNPQSLTLTATPRQPVSVRDIIASALGLGQTLEDLLGLKLVVNKA